MGAEASTGVTRIGYYSRQLFETSSAKLPPGSSKRNPPGLMGDVAKHGRTILFVSHNMAAVKSLCRKTIWLDEGRIIEAGETEKVVTNYLQKGARVTLAQVWNEPASAPGDGVVSLRQISITALGQGADEAITVQTAIEVNCVLESLVGRISQFRHWPLRRCRRGDL